MVFLRRAQLPLTFGKAAVAVAFLALAIALAPSLPKGAAAAETGWTSTHYPDHPLAGTIWTPDGEAATRSKLEEALAKAHFVLLGEIHDNPDHHRLQAQLIEALVKRGRRPAVVFEMISSDQQSDLDSHAKDGPGEAGQLGKALRWEERGWPDWAIYQPVAEAALSAALPLVAGGLGKAAREALAKGEPSPANRQIVEELGIASPLEPALAEAQRNQINEGHCNLLPDSALEPMMRMQRGLDAALAKAMASAEGSDGAVLIAGAGHVRNDWGVPAFLREKAPEAAVVSIAFIEADPERLSPSDYVKTVPGFKKPYDYIYFTPRAELEDHCAEMEKHLKSKKSGATGNH